MEAELDLDEIDPPLYRLLRLLEPYGTGNHEPAFSARAVQLMAPPKILKDKHIKLKLKAGTMRRGQPTLEELANESQEELSAEAIVVTPRCHPDGAAIRRSQRTDVNRVPKTEDRKLNPVFDALGWHMAEQLQASPLLAGDAIDIAFTIGHNDHPDFGGLELGLRDFRAVAVAKVESKK